MLFLRVDQRFCHHRRLSRLLLRDRGNAPGKASHRRASFLCLDRLCLHIAGDRVRRPPLDPTHRHSRHRPVGMEPLPSARARRIQPFPVLLHGHDRRNLPAVSALRCLGHAGALAVRRRGFRTCLPAGRPGFRPTPPPPEMGAGSGGQPVPAGCSRHLPACGHVLLGVHRHSPSEVGGGTCSAVSPGIARSPSSVWR